MKRTIYATSITLLLAAAVSLLAVSGCGGRKTAEDQAKTANLVYVNWAEGVAYTHLAKAILEDKMGYTVNITAADAGPAYTSVAQGDQDAFMETWLPVLHKDYVDKFKEDILDLGTVYEGTQSGLVVPAYVTIDRISQINDHKDKFDGKITGIDSGAGVMKTTEEVIEMYDLEVRLLASSGPAMTASLRDAVEEKEWIVVTGWRPHWMFGRWDLKFLEQDEDKTVWKKGTIHIMGRKNLLEDKPELGRFLQNMHFTDPQLAGLMLEVEESSEPIETVVRAWMDENAELVESWIP